MALAATKLTVGLAMSDFDEHALVNEALEHCNMDLGVVARSASFSWDDDDDESDVKDGADSVVVTDDSGSYSDSDGGERPQSHQSRARRVGDASRVADDLLESALLPLTSAALKKKSQAKRKREQPADGGAKQQRVKAETPRPTVRVVFHGCKTEAGLEDTAACAGAASSSSSEVLLVCPHKAELGGKKCVSLGAPGLRARVGAHHAGGGSEHCVQSLPERAEYRCSACGEDYTMRSTLNPWWALVQHECPKCGKLQFPSVNIAAPANQISYLSEATSGSCGAALDDEADEDTRLKPPLSDDDEDDEDEDILKAVLGASSSDPSSPRPPSPPRSGALGPGLVLQVAPPTNADAQRALSANAARADAAPPVVSSCSSFSSSSTESSEGDEAACVKHVVVVKGELALRTVEDDGELDEACVAEAAAQAAENAVLACLKPSAAPAAEPLAAELSEQLFALMEHARYCPGHHTSPQHAQVCESAKYIMLHVRDCAGTLPNGAACPFSWCSICRATVAKHLDL